MVWGEATMVEAERLLFAAALQDPANQRFVLLSDRWGGSFCLFLRVLYLTDLVRTYTVQILVEMVHDEMRDMLAVLLSTNFNNH